MKVSTLGLMRDRASQRTIVLRSTPQARPKGLVQVLHPVGFARGAAETDALGTGEFEAEAGDIRLSPLSVRRFPPGRVWCRDGESPARGCHWGGRRLRCRRLFC